MVRYTQKTRDVLNFIKENGFITASICSKVFYKNNKYGINQARNMLNKLVDNKDLISSKQEFGKQLIYQDKKKTISDHNYYIVNLYSEIFNLVTRVDYFKIDERWLDGKRRCDAHIIFTNIINGEEYTKGFFIEFDKFHKTDKGKYDEIYESNEVQDWYKSKFGEELFPDVLIINYNGKTNLTTQYEYNVVAIDYNFSDILQKIIF